jgi:hypothetical protein
MSMKRNRKRILRDPQGRELEEWEEEDAFELNGMLKDGDSLRVPLYMKDGTPMDDGFSRAIVDSYKRGRSGAEDKLVIDTSAPPMVVDAFGGVEGLNRPGARYLAAGHRTVDHAVMTTLAAMRDEAYKAYDEEAQNAWRGRAPTDATRTRDSAEQAYLDYDREMSEAWRNAR